MAVNLLSVLVSVIAVFILGALWYGPLFGKTWIRLMDFSEKHMKEAKRKGMAKQLVINFISSFIMAYILAYFIQVLFYSELNAILFLAFLIWIGFIATTTLGSVLWEGKNIKLYLINNLYSLVSLVIMSLILRMWI